MRRHRVSALVAVVVLLGLGLWHRNTSQEAGGDERPVAAMQANIGEQSPGRRASPQEHLPQSMTVAYDPLEQYLAKAKPDGQAVREMETFFARAKVALGVEFTHEIQCGARLCKALLQMHPEDAQRLQYLPVPEGVELSYYLEMRRRPVLVIYATRAGIRFRDLGAETSASSKS